MQEQHRRLINDDTCKYDKNEELDVVACHFLCNRNSHLDRDLVDFVEHVDARHVHSVAFDDVDQILGRGVIPIGRIYFTKGCAVRT